MILRHAWVIFGNTMGLGGLWPCSLNAQLKNKESKINFWRQFPLKRKIQIQTKQRFCHSIYSYSKLKCKGDDVTPIDSHVTSEEERRKLYLPYFHLSNFKFKTLNSKNSNTKLQKKTSKRASPASRPWMDTPGERKDFFYLQFLIRQYLKIQFQIKG